MRDSALYHATVMPLKNIRIGNKSNYHAIREIIRDSMQKDLDGGIYKTLKWVAYQKWNNNQSDSPSFSCPHCLNDVDGLKYDADTGSCNMCHKEIWLTDMIGFHLDMEEDSAPESIATSYMLIHETLFLFWFISYLWNKGNSNDLSKILFIKDGPLTLRSQYSKLVPNIRNFLQYAKEQGTPVYIIGQEKTGKFYDHLKSIEKYVSPSVKGELPAFSVLTHKDVRQHVYRVPDLRNPYGKRTNYGEKVYVKLDPFTSLVINITTGEYSSNENFPQKDDLIGFDRILATLPGLISHRHEGALIPIELANGVASLSSYPSAAILKVFSGIG